MAITPKVIDLITLADGAPDTYSPGAGETVTISTLSAHNTESPAATVIIDVHIDSDGAAATIAERFASFNVPADGTVLFTSGITLDENATLTVEANGGTANIHLFGILET